MNNASLPRQGTRVRTSGGGDRRVSIAADLEHCMICKPLCRDVRVLAEAAALDQEETRWSH